MNPRQKDKKDANASFSSPYKYGISPFFKLLWFIIITLLAFYPMSLLNRLLLLTLEIVFAFIIKVDFSLVYSFAKFLFLNFFGLFFLFYLAEQSFLQAFFVFMDYALKLLVVSLGAFIFSSMTPPIELIQGLKSWGVPPLIAFSIMIALQFLPLLTKKVKEILIIQKARGYKLRLLNLSPILIPSLLYVIDLSLNLALSLENRGFSIQSSYFSRKKKDKEITLLSHEDGRGFQ